MTYVEYAEKIGLQLNSAQIEILNLFDKHKDESILICLPRGFARGMIYNLIQQKKGYEQGRVDAIDECIKTITNLCGGLPNISIMGALERLKEQKICDECYDCKYYIDNTDEYFECTGQDKPCCDFVEVEQLKKEKN